ncbi:SNF2-related [Moorella glycerini]|uniref:RNA polymerase-associated protein RapA n=1 Tax=Neomoorella stamsii TaxID=1266720 RepID=A0A9X7J5N4_9FIRM|nr:MULTISPECIES: SNF2-related protein [Moorella]PRR76753.1 RNA polymerase-associated protein RapA [Moorella stamsii]CEP66713.1 SNF2-related [Moorella glycerini]
MQLEKGMYVRCPVDAEDPDNPRLFALGQIKSINDLAGTVDVILHDPYDFRRFYDFIPRGCKLPIRRVRRCLIYRGSTVLYKGVEYKLLACANEGAKGLRDYYIQCTGDGNQIIKASEKDLQVPFTQIEYSPLLQLAEYEFHHPSWYKNRLLVSKIMHILDNAIYGFKTLAGCRVFLMPHQIYTIVRCLEDRPCRYMLADEVGLGKTIEACSVVKIMHEENTNLRVLFVVPGSLAEQWRTELIYKFTLVPTLYKPGQGFSPLSIVAVEELDLAAQEGLKEGRWDICIVDEAHRLLGLPREYEHVKDLSRNIENILFLSATPIQARKNEYLKLLVLLHPDQYENMDMETFESLLARQGMVQKRVYSILNDMEEYEDYCDTIYDQLIDIADDLKDDNLKDIVKKIDINGHDHGIENARLALAYICEHYRLERRMIRNRRVLLKESLPRRNLEAVTYQMAGSEEFYYERNTYEALLQWIKEQGNNIDDESVLNTIQPLLAAFFSSPWAFAGKLEELGVADTNLAYNAGLWCEAAENEHRMLSNVLDDPDLIRGRLVKIIDYLEQELCLDNDKAPKVVVFTRYKVTLEKFLELAQKRFGQERYAAFYSGMSQEELSANVDRFQKSDICKLMICDELGGEGRNFQIADFVVHLDLPWSVNELEQRIGRLDRIGREKERDVVSVVIYAEGTIEEQLFKLWDRGLNVFKKSISGLEIILGELNRQIALALIKDVEFGLSETIDSIIHFAQEMKKVIEEEQYYDAAAIIYRPLSRQLEQMVKYYQANENEMFATAMMTWASQAGLNGEGDTTNGSQIIRFRENAFSIRSAENTLLVPPDWAVYRDYPMVRQKDSITGTFDRMLAIKREDLLFYAPGDPVFDSIIENALSCGRGRACAFAELGEFEWKGLVFVWSIEPDIKPLLEVKGDLRCLTQFRGFLPLEQIFTLYPLDEESAQVNPGLVKEHLIKPYTDRSRKTAHLGQRSKNRDFLSGLTKSLSNLKWFKQQYPREEWISILKKASNQCFKEAKEQVKKRMDLKEVQNEVDRIVNAFRASSIYFGRDAIKVIRLREIYDVVLKCISRPKITLDSAAYYWVVKQNEND